VLGEAGADTADHASVEWAIEALRGPRYVLLLDYGSTAVAAESCSGV
jgi:hypothetical protein